MKRLASVVLCLCLACPVAWGQEPGIRVTGRYTLVIQEAPFTLTAPAGGDLYFWNVPPSWNTTDQNDSLVVTKAPEGAYSPSVMVITIDWSGKKTTKKTYVIALAVGKMPEPGPGPGPGPGPQPPAPDAELVRTLQAAFNADAGEAGQKTRWRSFLAAIYRAAADKEVADPAFATFGQLLAHLRAAVAREMSEANLLKVREAVAADIRARMPGVVPDAPMTDAFRAMCKVQFQRLSLALDAVK